MNIWYTNSLFGTLCLEEEGGALVGVNFLPEGVPELEPLPRKVCQTPLLAEAEEQGFVLRGIRPLAGLAPCWLFLFSPQAAREETVWVPLADWARLALWLSRGWGAVGSRPGGEGPELALCPA